MYGFRDGEAEFAVVSNFGASVRYLEGIPEDPCDFGGNSGNRPREDSVPVSRPLVVAVKEGHPVSACLGDGAPARTRHPLIGLTNDSYLVLEFGRDLFCRAIGRSVVDYNNLVNAQRLGQNAFYCPFNVTAPIVRGNEGRDSHLRAFPYLDRTSAGSGRAPYISIVSR